MLEVQIQAATTPLLETSVRKRQRRGRGCFYFSDPETGEIPPPGAAALARQEVRETSLRAHQEAARAAKEASSASSATTPTTLTGQQTGTEVRGKEAKEVASRVPWSAEEERRLVEAAERLECRDWRAIVSLAQCERPVFEAFQHYQLHLNSQLSRNAWTAEEDAVLTQAVEVFTFFFFFFFCPFISFFFFFFTFS